MPQILKDLTLGEFMAEQSSALYNTDTVTVTATAETPILPGQPITENGVVAVENGELTAIPLGIATEAVTLEAGETYDVAVIKNGYGVVLNRSKLEERYPELYPAAQLDLEAKGFVFKN